MIVMDFKDIAVLIIAIMLGVLLFFDKIEQSNFFGFLTAILLYFGVRIGYVAGRLSKGG
jgi:TctA family transporter